MKKTLLLALFTSIALHSGACGCNSFPNNYGESPYQDKDYADWGKLRLVENQLSDKNGDPVQLKGWSTFSLHYKGHCKGEGDWNLMKQYGANIVRLAMYIDDPKDGGSYIAKPDYFKDLIKQSIAETKALNMYCIVDWHTTPDSLLSGDPNDYIAESKDFFGEISKYCADNGYDNVLYEICNESTCGWPNIKSYAEDVIPVITANQPDAIIIVGTDQWCQKMGDPILNPIKSDYKKNVMYSFHYAACSHYHLLGDFRNAQKNIPVFVSEWSAVKFNGEGPFCGSNSDEMIAACENIPQAPQLVSWCVWNWGSKEDEASSFFNGSCDSDHISEYPSIDYSNKEYGSYILELMGYRGETLYCDSYWPTPNTIPSTNTSLWSWGDYNQGGESIGYHDANSGAWKTDENGIVVGYRNDGEEVDVHSLAKMMQWINEKCPWSTVEDGEVVSFDSTISTKWKDANGNPTYRSLNAGRMYSDPDSLVRPDEGVDLKYANLRGTNYEGRNYYSLYLVEDGEWISYTVDVEKAGYYKIKGLISSEYKAANKNGEISIYSWNNHLRSSKNLADTMLITTFGFPKINSCADAAANVSDYHNCWAETDAISGEYKEVFVAFPESGLQGISFRFSGDASGVGPLIFEWHGELDPNDPIVCGECENENGDVDDVDATKFSINPNPTSGEFTLTLVDNVEASVEVVNMAGQVVVSQKIVGSATINKSLTAGVYTVIVKSNGGVSTQKLVVK